MSSLGQAFWYAGFALLIFATAEFLIDLAEALSDMDARVSDLERLALAKEAENGE